MNKPELRMFKKDVYTFKQRNSLALETLERWLLEKSDDLKSLSFLINREVKEMKFFGKDSSLDPSITKILTDLKAKVKIDFRLASDYDQFSDELIRITESLFESRHLALLARCFVLKALFDVHTQKPNLNI